MTDVFSPRQQLNWKILLCCLLVVIVEAAYGTHQIDKEQTELLSSFFSLKKQSRHALIFKVQGTTGRLRSAVIAVVCARPPFSTHNNTAFYRKTP